MRIHERDTSAPVTPEMVRTLVESLKQSPEIDQGFGTEFAVRADRLDDAISMLEQVANQL